MANVITCRAGKWLAGKSCVHMLRTPQLAANPATASLVTEEQAETWLEEVFEEAERLLRARWGDVERVAAALIERRRLSREDLWDLLPEAGPVTPR